MAADSFDLGFHTADAEDRADLGDLMEGWRRYQGGLSGEAAEPAFHSTKELADWADAPVVVIAAMMAIISENRFME